jgi:hypothetical protein
MANDLDDLDGANGDPQPAKGRGLVIVDLGHTTIMPRSWMQQGGAGLAGPARDGAVASAVREPLAGRLSP